MNDIQTIASLTIAGRENGCRIRCRGRGADHPFARHDGGARDGAGSLSRGWTSRSVSPDQVYYVTDEQFGYVAYVQGLVVRERPAACFYLGSFFAESLILAEMGNGVRRVQIAGTAQPAQLPFFVAACDYADRGRVLCGVGLSPGEPINWAVSRGRTSAKLIVAAGIIVGVAAETLATVTGSAGIRTFVDFLINRVLT